MQLTSERGYEQNIQAHRQGPRSPAAPPLGTSTQTTPRNASSTAPAATTASLDRAQAAPAAVYADPRAAARQKLQRAEATREQHQQTQEVRALAQKDREVRAHEQAHAAVGGKYAGAASYQTVRGPDGVSYAVAGEVPISTGKEATPEETLHKAQIVRRAALAPAEPSGQDRKVAAMARSLEIAAQLEIAQQQRQELSRVGGATGTVPGGDNLSLITLSGAASETEIAPPGAEGDRNAARASKRGFAAYGAPAKQVPTLHLQA